MNVNNIFLIQDLEGSIILNDKNDIKMWANDNVVLKSDIDSLINIELSEGSHYDFIEDYNSQLDFYLSNVTKDSYKEFVKAVLDTINLNDAALEAIQGEVIEGIKRSVSE